jgi:hypothetical protein
MTMMLVMRIVEGPGTVVFGANEDVCADGTSTVDEAPVESDVKDPLAKLEDGPPLPLLELGYTGEYGGGAEYWRGRTCFGNFTDHVSIRIYLNSSRVVATQLLLLLLLKKKKNHTRKSFSSGKRCESHKL